MEWIQVSLDPRLFVDLVLAVVIAEAFLLVALLRSSGRGSQISQFLIPLASGAVLLLALRLTVGEKSSLWFVLLLAVAGVFHLLDLRARWRAQQEEPPENLRKSTTQVPKADQPHY